MRPTARVHRMPPGPERQKLRSITPPGFAQAFFKANPKFMPITPDKKTLDEMLKLKGVEAKLDSLLNDPNQDTLRNFARAIAAAVLKEIVPGLTTFPEEESDDLDRGFERCRIEMLRRAKEMGIEA